VPLILWRMYGRIRRLVGRQRSVAWRHWTAVVLFPMLLLLLATGAVGKPMTLASLVIGVVVGVGLAVYGLRLTRFETTGQGMFYTPSAHIGIGLSLLFVGRVLYRFFQVFEGALAQHEAVRDFGASPLTRLVFGMLAGYYAAYAVGLLRSRRMQSSSMEKAPLPERTAK
jgi:hypothetical protein